MNRRSKAPPRVLLVEDDREMRLVLRLALQDRGYDVVEAVNGSQALAQLRVAPPSLMILDLGLPDIDGIDVTLRVRHEHALPILVLSARDEESQKVRALDAGANDYVTKPFREGELMARVRSALRYSPGARDQDELEVGAIRMCTRRREVFLKGALVNLTRTEFKLLHVLLSEAGRVVAHRELLTQVWGATSIDELSYLRVYMRGLRANLEDDAARPRRLLTVLGVGYRCVQ
jgi:two-component system KDP operon response regulator KdpE